MQSLYFFSLILYKIWCNLLQIFCTKIVYLSHNSLIYWSQLRDLNSWPTDYESVALPTELSWLSFKIYLNFYSFYSLMYWKQSYWMIFSYLEFVLLIFCYFWHLMIVYFSYSYLKQFQIFSI